MVEIGFTGTRRGMTNQQKETVTRIIQDLPHVRKAHEGDCIGSDHDFCHICNSLDIKLVGHPPDVPTYRAFHFKDVMMLPPKPYLERNDDIIKFSKIMIATPGEYIEKKRSGTWYTIRHARKARREIFIVFPDGLVKHEEGS